MYKPYTKCNIGIEISAPRDPSCTSTHSRFRTDYRYHTFFGTDYMLPAMEPIVHGCYGPFSFTCCKMYPVILSGLGITVVYSKPSQCKIGKNPSLSYVSTLTEQSLFRAASIFPTSHFNTPYFMKSEGWETQAFCRDVVETFVLFTCYRSRLVFGCRLF